MDALPKDITTTILAKLSIRDVLRCKSVCKTWCSIISNPIFPDDLHSSSNSNPSSSFIALPYICPAPARKFNIIEYHHPSSPCISKINLPYLPRQGSSSDDDDQWYLLSSSNGLVLLTTLRNMNPDSIISLTVCNPVTQEYLKLPNLYLKFPDYCTSFEFDPGFGFYPFTKKFKVVVISSGFAGGCNKTRKVQVYTHGSNSWRTISNSPDTYGNGVLNSRVFLNGSAHWLFSLCGLSETPFAIVSFDMERERFGVIPMPPSNIRVDGAADYYQLGELQGCLSLSDCWTFRDRCDIWVMNDYNVQESWTKRFSITKRIDCVLMHPISLWRNRELILLYNYLEFVSYNLVTREYTSIGDEQLNDWGKFSSCAVSPFVGSLISLKSICRKRRAAKKVLSL